MGGDVEVINCTDYEDRFSFKGDYHSSECGVTISNATKEDMGEWTCEFEEYYSGKTRNYGDKITGKVQVEVELITTTTTTTTTTPTTIMAPVTSEGDVKSSEDKMHKHPKALDGLISNMTRGKSDAAAEAIVGEDDEEVDSASATTPVVVAMCLLILVGGLALVYGLHYKRRLHPMFYSVLSANRWKPMNNDILNNTNIIKNENMDTELEAIEGIPAAKILDKAKVTYVAEEGGEETKDKGKVVSEEVNEISASKEDLKLGVLHSDL